MKKLFGTAFLSFAATGSAQAADMALPVKAPPPAPWSWTGFYIGGNGGHGWGNWDSSSLTAIFPGPRGTFVNSASPNAKGAIAGRQIAGFAAVAGRRRSGRAMERRESQ